MHIITEEEYRQELEKANKESQSRKYRNDIRDARNKYRKSFRFETSKLFTIYLFVLLNAIVIYSMVAMWKFQDLSYLGVLITDIAAQILVFGIYCLKAFKAKKEEEEIKLKREKYAIDDVLSAFENNDELLNDIDSDSNSVG